MRRRKGLRVVRPGFTSYAFRTAVALATGIPLCAALGAQRSREVAAPRLKMIRESVLDPAALVYPKRSYGYTPNSVSCQGSAMGTHRGWQYVTWWDGARRLCVARRKLPHAAWETIRFEDYRHRATDTHNTAELGICAKDGTIHLAFDHHCHPLHYRVSAKGAATSPAEVKWTAGLFGSVTSRLNKDGKRLGSVTYPKFRMTPAGNLLLLWRTGSSGNGDWLLAEYDGASGRWTVFGVVLSRHGSYRGSGARCAYPNGLDFDANGRLHMSWCWRETGNPRTNHDVCYAYSDDGGRTWFDSTGRRAGKAGTKPIRVDTPGIAVWKVDPGNGLINSCGQAIDGKGRMHIVVRQGMSGFENPRLRKKTRNHLCYVHYWRDLSGTWHQAPIDPNTAMGARPEIRSERNDTLYLVSDPVHVAAAAAASGWKDWRVVYTHPTAFLGEPVIDYSRWKKEQILSVFGQTKAGKLGVPAPLLVVDLASQQAIERLADSETEGK